MKAKAAKVPVIAKLPSEDEKRRIVAALGRHLKRASHVTASVAMDAPGAVRIEAPHSDYVGWRVRLADTFGTASHSFVDEQLGHLAKVAAAGVTNGKAAETATNSMLAAVAGAKPANEMEAQLAVQMTATHHAAMRCLTHATGASSVEAMDAAGNLATKLLRTYTKQLEAMAKPKRGGEQKVTVEHVHVYQGGQAIVGNVNVPQDYLTGGHHENKGQPYELSGSAAFALPALGSMRGEEQGRDPVHVARDQGEGAMPASRRRQRVRRTEG
ncbi:hypothetical protein [Methylobacterium sp. J-068]|uniref:hypothetical protein n=1 Tax=Methylobacterium sp. J-068 TaxID=2836649 RepID=UPI001FBB42A2|nr:hypothetical protein [Methylobacterium sp. J-068]MCJ2035616.1 hypothetical protein [Methylobacterium sp. J-068]